MRILRGRRPLYAASLAVYVLLRVGFAGVHPQVYTDTASYEQTAHEALWSSGFWAGVRGFTVPLFYKIVPDDTARILLQLAFSIVAWSALAWVFSRRLRSVRGAYVGFVAVLVFSLTRYVVGWDPLLLSESFTLSLFALLVAAVLVVTSRPTQWSVGALLLAAVAWTFVRDSNGVVVLLGGIVALLLAISPRHRALKLAIGVAAVAVFVASAVSADAGGRWRAPFAYVLKYRVPAQPELERYMLARHDKLRYDNASLAAERRTYLVYLATHPVYLLAEPFVGRQDVPWSSRSKAGSLFDPKLDPHVAALNSTARPVRRVFDVVWIHSLAGALALAGAALLCGLVTLRRRPSPSGWISLAVLLSAFPLALASWHFEAGDIDRHSLGAAVALRLGAFLVLAYAVDRLLADREEAGRSEP